MASETERVRQPVAALSFHANYGCKDTGVCCSSGWEIAVEAPVERALRSQFRDVAARLPNGPDGFLPMLNPPAGCESAFRSDATATCWFRDASARKCAVHREFGEQALPSACRQFPRVAILEPHRVSVSLSHYCPTAAHLLFEDAPGNFGVVENPRAFPNDWPFEGLDAQNSYSPLLRPGVLLGFDGLRAFETSAVRALSRPGVHTGLSQIGRAVTRIREWTPVFGPVPGSVGDAFDAAAQLLPSSGEPLDPRSVLRASTPSGGPPLPDLPPFLGSSRTFGPLVDLALRRYLAARLIAGWVVFLSDDLSAVSAYLRLCLSAVFLFESARPRQEGELDRWRESIRSADLWLLHYCDPELLVRHLR